VARARQLKPSWGTRLINRVRWMANDAMAAMAQPLMRIGRVGAGATLLLLALMLAASLLGYTPGDPALNTATYATAKNWMGWPGAYASDLFLQLFGVGAWLLLIPLTSWGVRLMQGLTLSAPKRRVVATFATALLAAPALATLGAASLIALPAGYGGGLGQVMLRGLTSASDAAGIIVPLWAIALPFAVLALVTLLWALGLTGAEWANMLRRDPILRSHDDDEQAEPLAFQARGPGPVLKRQKRAAARVVRDDDDEDDIIDEPAPSRIVTEMPAQATKTSKRQAGERQRPLSLGDRFELPPIDLLVPGPRNDGKRDIDNAALEQNARLLEEVLADFGVRGEIVQVRPGPVVTLYELEPAPGIKSMRVINLADDIARSMSALSARVAVVPGRNVIGIELPNAKRETVAYRDLVAHRAFEQHKGSLPLVLGKDISGEPVIADLAPMPHLLIAGTTGSGKSVGLNAMILSLLYRLTPSQCRFIMIDPKMLELSVYDGIPHLLAPVVTEPKKAIVALKWAVREMDERYRKMSKLGVRNIAGFNERVTEAKSKNRSLARRVMTGYTEGGEPIYEEQNFDFEPLPMIVVVVDEFADLMLVAGKEVESLVQRLAQKARAAGIHVMLATQRPSVDVITGTIKANLPTRVSFQVTSKIDSRTILGDQGAEQLLGKGDMLYMAGGKQLFRVHGPFVTDEEVERVADHLRAQGAPQYVDGVTEGGDEDEEGGGFGGDDDEDGGSDLYRRAIQIVAADQKASTSYIQRRLQVGYNKAASLIERMERDGYVGPANHVGKREVLINPDGSRL
jgi:DNA segregation ATPase FtsK/SpoIIIE, S-DNA-T family